MLTSPESLVSKILYSTMTLIFDLLIPNCDAFISAPSLILGGGTKIHYNFSILKKVLTEYCDRFEENILTDFFKWIMLEKIQQGENLSAG